MKKIKVYSSQFNYQYGTSIHFPYSIASLFSYINSFPKLKKKFQYAKIIIVKLHTIGLINGLIIIYHHIQTVLTILFHKHNMTQNFGWCKS